MDKREQLHRLKERDFCLKISKTQVLNRMECYPDSRFYEKLSGEYDELIQAIHPDIKPKTAFVRGVMPKDTWNTGIPSGTEVLFLLSTIGERAGEYSSEFFFRGDYVKGMMSDYIADAYLFEMEKKNIEAIRAYCAKIHRGVAQRLEVPGKIPMEAQKLIFEAVSADKTLGMGILESYMYQPVKSMGQIYVLSEEETLFKAQHNCRNCTNITCNMREVW